MLPRDPYKEYNLNKGNIENFKELNKATAYITEQLIIKKNLADILIKSKVELGYPIDLKFVHRLYSLNVSNPMLYQLYQKADNLGLMTKDTIKTYCEWEEYISIKHLENPKSFWSTIYVYNIHKDKNLYELTDLFIENL